VARQSRNDKIYKFIRFNSSTIQRFNRKNAANGRAPTFNFTHFHTLYTFHTL